MDPELMQRLQEYYFQICTKPTFQARIHAKEVMLINFENQIHLGHICFNGHFSKPELGPL